MKPRSVILIVMIVLLPLAALTWTVLRLAENEQVVVRQRYRDLMEERLGDLNTNVSLLFEENERYLSQLTAIDIFEPDSLREITRTEPRLLQMFVLSPLGQLAYPNPVNELNSTERTFLIQASKMFTGQDLKEAVARAEQLPADGNRAGGLPDPAEVDQSLTRRIYNRGEGVSQNSRVPQLSQQLQQAIPLQRAEIQQQAVRDVYVGNEIRAVQQMQESSGWFVWYWDRGVNLIYWQRRPSGFIVGCALERARWMADLISQLPETVDASSGGKLRSMTTRIRLVNESAASVYQWGGFEPSASARPFCEIPLADPLASWRLQCFIPEEQLQNGTRGSLYVGLITGLLGVAAAIAVITFFFMREYARDMRQAAQQVSFVNQVSHELKTPLTNIRMYAEMLDADLDKLDESETEKSRSRLNVILSEGQRLSRLIGNVLTFARQKRKTLQLQPRELSPCELTTDIVDRFRPAFEEQQIEIQLSCSDGGTLRIDPDVVEQILGNLISNVEKYAGSGGVLKIDASMVREALSIDVFDAGPGIENSKRRLIFEPFSRVSNDVSYAAGTGIGLSIARELARLHGGDLELLDSESGCHFRATLKNQVQ